MVIWGAIWGALIGLLTSRHHDEGLALVAGALLGALAGRTLRRAVDRRVAALLAQERAASAPASAAERPGSASEAAEEVLFDEPPEVEIPAAEAAPFAPRPEIPAPPAAAAAEPVPPPEARPSSGEALAARIKAWLLGGNTVARLGALVLFIGLAFLARLAAERGLVPPELRLAGIGAAALGLLALGFRLRGRRPGYALTLQGAGVAILYLTLFAAFRLYALIPPGLAFALMVAVCALSSVLAVLQDALALAVMGAAGGFLSPILASSGQGDHVALFTYYALLNLGILGIAWKRDWRLLNLVGFGFTFGIGTLWGVLRFRPEQYASAQPFLILFVALYVAVAVLFALRRAPSLKDYVDGTLVFGTPLVGFGLQAGLVRHIPFGLAWSAIAVSALYLLLAGALARRRLGPLQLLVESFIALGVIFASLAVPLALDARWTASAWALEGAAVVWVGLRQQRRLARAFGLLLQFGGLLAFAAHLAARAPQNWPLLNADFIGAALLCASALLIAYRLQRHYGGRGAARGRYEAFEQACTTPLALYGFAWWIGAAALELTRRAVTPAGTLAFVFRPQERPLLLMLAFAAGAAAAAWQGLARRWTALLQPAHATLPVLLLGAVYGSAHFQHLFAHGGAWIWPLAIAIHLWTLKRIDHRPPAAWFTAVHAGGVLLLLLLGWSAIHQAIAAADLWHTDWGPAGALLALSGVLSGVGLAACATAPRGLWPMDRFARAYGWYALIPVAALTGAGALLLTLTRRGDASPLPSLPLLNPVDLAFLLACAALWQWRARLRASLWPLPALLQRGPAAPILAAATLFLWLNTVWLRLAHHHFAVPWRADRLLASFVVQAGYALLWTITATGVMVFASRRGLRRPWLAGAALLGLTVVKLILIDLSNAGGMERIVAFIGVGGLMLLVGYLAPLPPRTRPSEARPA
jgi:uncharacterized membrane protein